MMKILLYILVVILSLGCKKYKLNDEQKVLVGDYEWGFATNTNNESISQNTYSIHYGIRIKENSKIYLFKDGEIVYKGVITSLIPYETDRYFIYTESNSEFRDFEYINGIITSKDWPIENYINYYFK